MYLFIDCSQNRQENRRSITSQGIQSVELESMNKKIQQLEAENRKLSQKSSTQKESYEKCLEEVTEKVTTALNCQKVT